MRLAVIYNPVAGSNRRERRYQQLLNLLRQNGHQLTIFKTNEPGDGTREAQRALEEGCEALLTVGGDGTINEVIQALAGTGIPLAVYPAGTTNVWCKQIGVSANPKEVVKTINAGICRKVDLGKLEGRYFLLMVGVGLDGEITRAIDLKLKKRVGKIAYALAALRLGLFFRPGTAKIRLHLAEDTPKVLELKTALVIVTNTERYAIMKLAREARMDDGLLEVLAFKEKNFWSRFSRAFSIVLSQTERDKQVKRFRVRQVQIEMERSVALQVDGDAHGQTGLQPLTIECVPAALTVIVPQEAASRLFRHAVNPE